MKRLAVLTLVMTALVGATSASAGTGGAARALGGAPGSPGADAVHSAVVRLWSPSVYAAVADQLPPAPWPAAPARQSKLGQAVRQAEAAALQSQEPGLAAARRLGVEVVGRFVTAANGLLVHGTAPQLAALAAAGPWTVEPAPQARLHLLRSVPRVGADALAASKGYAGQGTIIAVLDSGIDYTHAAFGGPGTPEAYNAAAADAERIDDTYDDRPLFPTAKVIGGWDFVGPNYTSPDFCPPASAAAGLCTSTPHPDPDPLDQAGHGTHVASAAAGLATPGLGHGVAPEARLLALKIYGPPKSGADTDEAADVVMDAIDWCVRVNLGLEVPGIAPPAGQTIDVANLSFGETYAQGSLLYDQVIDAAVGAGIVVVGAAGNGGNLPFVITSPGTSPHALSVASISLGAEPAGDTMAGHSGRGPSRFGALKPDIAAPGEGINTALLGTGTGSSATSGTSLATPHVAGAAALLAQRSKSEGLGLDALDIGSLLMNYAMPLLSGDGGAAPGVARQGSGRLAVDRAGVAPVVIRAGDVASLNLGAMSLTEPAALERQLAVRNLTDGVLGARVSAQLVGAAPSAAGLTVVVPNQVSLPPGRRNVTVSFNLEPSQLAPWATSNDSVNATDLDRLELSGYVRLDFTDEAGQPMDASPASVPFYVLARRAADVSVLAGSDSALDLVDRAAFEGRAEFFVLPDGGRAADPDEPDVTGEADVRQIGVRFEPAAQGTEAALAFGVSLYAAPAVPLLTVLELYVDTDLDGVADYRVRSGPESELVGGAENRVAVSVVPWDGAAGQPGGQEVLLGSRTAELYSSTSVVRVPLSALGQQAPFAFDFWAIDRGVGEDWLASSRMDVVPDGALGPCPGRSLEVRPLQWAGLPETWSILVPSSGDRQVARTPGGDGLRVPALLALFPDNRFESVLEQAQAVLYGAGPEPPSGGGCMAWLPVASRHQVIKQSEADALMATGLDVTGAQQWVKVEHYLTDPRNPAGDARRTYRFNGAIGMRMTYAPLQTDYYWDYIRVKDTVYVMRHREGVEGPWSCGSVDQWTVFWPEYVARMRSQFPTYGWRIESRGTPSSPNVWQLRNQDPDGTSYFAKVDKPSGLILILSQTRPSAEMDVYTFYDYGVVNIGLSKPPGIVCP